ncbi:MAG: heme-binding protein [Rickettsiales bacterium]|nr:heme-binding protein [Rickettsiales bacterium]
MTKKKWLITIICTVFIIGCAAGPVLSRVEQPKYQVVSSEGSIEMRRYAPMIIAEVTVTGEREDATGKGFRFLADYIFGNNTVKQDIAMTAPVQQQEAEKIAMTAPVQQQSEGNEWKIRFVMPSEYTMETLPEPNNDVVTLKEVPAKQFIAITFSGTNSDDNVAKHEAELLDYIQNAQIETIGTPLYAFYNPPWTLPLLRRNEVMIEVPSSN